MSTNQSAMGSQNSAALDSAWPRVSFALPVLNAAALLDRALTSIREQDYPREQVEIVVADGGSTDDTVAVARSHGARVVPNPRKLAEPGVDEAMRASTGEILFVMAADNGLPCKDWIRQMVQPFQSDPKIQGVFTHIVEGESDNAFTRYYCRLHVEPFTWFVYGPAANPRHFHLVYPVLDEGQGYVVYDYSTLIHPLLALAQGFGVRRRFMEARGETEHDDIIPIIQMIERGERLAYVPNAGVYHHHLNSFTHFVRKYRWRIGNSFYTENTGFDSRSKYMSPQRRRRKYLFELYGLTAFGPAVGALRLAIRERSMCMLWHAPATIALCWVILIEWLKWRLNPSADKQA